MPAAFWTSLAEAELEELLRYIRIDGQRPETAARLATQIRDAVDDHARLKLRGSRHPALPADWQYLKFKRWLIAYSQVSEGIVVQRIIDAVRDLPKQFGQD